MGGRLYLYSRLKIESVSTLLTPIHKRSQKYQKLEYLSSSIVQAQAFGCGGSDWGLYMPACCTLHGSILVHGNRADPLVLFVRCFKATALELETSIDHPYSGYCRVIVE